MYGSWTSGTSLLQPARVYEGHYRTFKACGRAAVTYYMLLLSEVPGRQLWYHIGMALTPSFAGFSGQPWHYCAVKEMASHVFCVSKAYMEANTDPATVTCPQHLNGSGGVFTRKAENTNHNSPKLLLMTRERTIELHLQGTSNLITRKGGRNPGACLQIAREGQE